MQTWRYDCRRWLDEESQTAVPTLGWNCLSVEDWDQLSVDDWDTLPVDGCPPPQYTYFYDATGNRTLRIDDAGNRATSTYDPANRLLTKVDDVGVTTYTYDANGNQRTIEEPSGDVTTQTWDYENRLVAVEHPSGDVVTSTYDPDHHRVAEDDGTAVKEFVYDGNNLLQERDDVGTLEAEYTYVPQTYAQFVSQRQDGDSSFYQTDGIHNVVQLTDDTEAVTDEYHTDAWGGTPTTTGSTPNPHTYKGEMGYQSSSQLSNGESELYRAGRSILDSDGRWKSPDPAPTDSNLYRPVDNNPVNNVDPSGLQPQESERERLLREIDENAAAGRAAYAEQLHIETQLDRISEQWEWVRANRYTGRQTVDEFRQRQDALIQRESDLRRQAAWQIDLQALARHSIDYARERLSAIPDQTPARAPAISPRAKQLEYIPVEVSPAFFKQIFLGEQSNTIRIYYDPSEQDAWAMAVGVAHKVRASRGIAELRQDIAVGQQATEIAIRAMLPGDEILDITEAAAEFKERPSLASAGNIGVVIVLGKAGEKLAEAGKAARKAVPSVRGGAFQGWFDKLSPEEFNNLWSDPQIRKQIEQRLRSPGGFHEWLPVSRAPVFKKWGISADQIHQLRTATKDVAFKSGSHGGDFSGTAHRQLFKLIDESPDFVTYVSKLRQWADANLVGGAGSLPEGLRP